MVKSHQDITRNKKRKRGIRFKAKDLERGRKYLWRDEFLPILWKYLGLERGQSVLDVGCGTGSFTRLVAKGLDGHGRVVGVDKNKRLLSVSRSISKELGFKKSVTFRYAEAESLPFPSDSVDRVVCQAMLWTIRKPLNALSEMARVCKQGGLVGAIEGAFDYVIFYFPDDSRLTELSQKYVRSYSLGHNRIYGSDRGIGYKLPSLFSEVGLKRVRLDALPYIWLEANDRIPFKFKLAEHKDYVRRYLGPDTGEREEDYRILKAGGMKTQEVDEMRELSYGRSRRVVDRPSLIQNDYSMNSGLYFLTTGVKE